MRHRHRICGQPNHEKRGAQIHNNPYSTIQKHQPAGGGRIAMEGKRNGNASAHFEVATKAKSLIKCKWLQFFFLLFHHSLVYCCCGVGDDVWPTGDRSRILLCLHWDLWVDFLSYKMWYMALAYIFCVLLRVKVVCFKQWFRNGTVRCASVPAPPPLGQQLRTHICYERFVGAWRCKNHFMIIYDFMKIVCFGFGSGLVTVATDCITCILFMMRIYSVVIGLHFLDFLNLSKYFTQTRGEQANRWSWLNKLFRGNFGFELGEKDNIGIIGTLSFTPTLTHS